MKEPVGTVSLQYDKGIVLRQPLSKQILTDCRYGFTPWSDGITANSTGEYVWLLQNMQLQTTRRDVCIL